MLATSESTVDQKMSSAPRQVSIKFVDANDTMQELVFTGDPTNQCWWSPNREYRIVYHYTLLRPVIAEGQCESSENVRRPLATRILTLIVSQH